MPVSRRALAPALVLSLSLAASSAVADEPTKLECVSANESAQELRDAGKLRAARSRLALCVAQSCPAPVREDCAQRLNEVDKAMPSLVFEASDPSGHDLNAVRVTMDGELLVDKLDATPVVVDPGQHFFVLEAQGLPQATRTLVVREGDKNRRERIALAAPSAAPAAEGATPGIATPDAVKGSAETPRTEGSRQRIIGLSVASAGVVGLAIGTVFGLASKSTYDHALGSDCGRAAGFADAKTCNATGYTDVHSARDQATVATVSVIAGAALLGGGAFLYFSARKAGPPVAVGATADAGSAALSARGWW